MRDFALRLGSGGVAALDYLGGASLLAARALYYSARPPFQPQLLLQQFDHLGVRSLAVASVAAFFTGLVLALQTAVGLARFGAKGYVGTIVALSMVRELGPVLTALLVGGRVGSGITAELGSMKVTEQIDALRALGVNHIKRLVVPRVLTTMSILPLLTVLADLLGILGGMVISAYEFGIDPHLYWNTVVRTLQVGDVLSGIGKSVCFGFLIGIIGCHQGLEAEGGTEGLGRATTTTVVTASLAILVSDFFLTKFFWWMEMW